VCKAGVVTTRVSGFENTEPGFQDGLGSWCNSNR